MINKISAKYDDLGDGIVAPKSILDTPRNEEIFTPDYQLITRKRANHKNYYQESEEKTVKIPKMSKTYQKNVHEHDDWDFEDKVKI